MMDFPTNIGFGVYKYMSLQKFTIVTTISTKLSCGKTVVTILLATAVIQKKSKQNDRKILKWLFYCLQQILFDHLYSIIMVFVLDYADNVCDVIVQLLSERRSVHTDDRYRSFNKHECELQSRLKQARPDM